jgi:DNA processing protein
MLIRDGAILVRNAADILEAIAPIAPRPEQLPLDMPEKPPRDRRTLRQTATLHSQILSRLGPSPLAEDQLIRDLATAPAKVAPVLVELELDGRIQRAPGGLLTRAS